MKPLEGIKVLDFTSFLSGPFCSLILSDLGAEVIHLERPLTGDTTRTSPPGADMLSTYFASCNRGKKSVICDLSNPEQREIFLKLAADADVLVENYKPGTMDKLNCGYKVLKEVNPRLVYTAISGYGQTGPWSKKGAFDLVIQAQSGLMSVTGNPNDAPMKSGTSIADASSGMWAAIGTLAALMRREKTGEGGYVDIAMLDSVFAILESFVARYCLTQVVPPRIGNRHPAGSPFSPYPTKDGSYVIICGVSNDQWWNICDTLNHPEWKEDERTNSIAGRTKYVDIVDERMASATINYTKAELIKLCQDHKIVHGEINNIKEACEHEQINARNMLVDVSYPGARTFRCANTPVKISGMEERTSCAAPELGVNTKEIMGKYCDEETYERVFGKLLKDCQEAFAKKALR